MENHPVFVFLSDSIVPESVDLLHVDMNMAKQVGMREGTSGVEKIVSSIQVVGPSHWGIDSEAEGAIVGA